MAIDVERMKCGVEELKKVLEEAEKIRSWALTKGASESYDGGQFSESLYRLEKILEPFEENSWDINKVFTLAATDGSQNDLLELTEGWHHKVNESVEKLTLDS